MQTGCRRKGVKSFLSEFKFRSRAGGGGRFGTVAPLPPPGLQGYTNNNASSSGCVPGLWTSAG